jgi:hypothetical protein
MSEKLASYSLSPINRRYQNYFVNWNIEKTTLFRHMQAAGSDPSQEVGRSASMQSDKLSSATEPELMRWMPPPTGISYA